MIYSYSFFMFYAGSWTGKRIVSELVGWSQHPWNMNISSSSSHQQQTRTHHAVSPWELRAAAVVLISRQVSEGLVGHSPSSSLRDMRCCTVIRQTLSRSDRDGETSSQGMMRTRHYCTTPSYDNRREKSFLRAPWYEDFLKNDSYSADQEIHSEAAHYAIFSILLLFPALEWCSFPRHFATVGFLRRILLHEINYLFSQAPSI
jgi:hypothetical protein